MQDFRIIALVNRGTLPTLQPNTSNDITRFPSFTYFNEIQVYPVLPDSTSPLTCAYNQINKVLTSDDLKNCESHQLITAFTNVKNSATGINSQDITMHTAEQIDNFWKDIKHPLFFMTMVNVSLHTDITKEIARIHQLFHDQQYLLYQTFEYNELLLFFRGSSFADYSELVMNLCFSSDNEGILDSITICGFQSDFPVEKLKQDPIPVHLQIGIRDYQKAIEYFQSQEPSIQNIHWLLGRNDICFLEANLSLKWLYNFCLQHNQNIPSWLSTIQISLPIHPGNSEGFTFSPKIPDIKSLCQNIRLRFSTFSNFYHSVCKKKNIPVDDVFLRMLNQLYTLVLNVLNTQLAEELAICLLPGLSDFTEYLSLSLSDNSVTEQSTESLRSRLNSFYLNILALINSTVHSKQEFIQIPNCSSPSFEMPPKIMAFYGLCARGIIDAFKDKDYFYGLMFSPKLVDELEVESLAIETLPPRNQLLSINIGERMLYDPRCTIAILGHEIAHFVGEETRLRDNRKEAILSYFSLHLLDILFTQIENSLPHYTTALNSAINDLPIADIAKDLGKRLYHDRKEPLVLKDLNCDIQSLPERILFEPEYSHIIIDEFLCPLFDRIAENHNLDLARPLYAGSKIATASSTITRYREIMVKELFCQVLPYCQDHWVSVFADKYFEEFIGYLFSETYADLAMIMLFDMCPDDYLRVFSSSLKNLPYRSGEKEDIIELTRFMAVFWSTCNSTCPFKIQNYEDSWSKQMVQAALAITADNDNLHRFCEKESIDYFLLTLLKDYLFDCSSMLKQQFEASNAHISKIRETYRMLNKPSTTQEYLLHIRSMETEYLEQLFSQ